MITSSLAYSFFCLEILTMSYFLEVSYLLGQEMLRIIPALNRLDLTLQLKSFDLKEMSLKTQNLVLIGLSF